jgi:hypothetical protein
MNVGVFEDFCARSQDEMGAAVEEFQRLVEHQPATLLLRGLEMDRLGKAYLAIVARQVDPSRRVAGVE